MPSTPLPPDFDAPAAESPVAFRRYERPARPRWQRYLLHLVLFLVTLATTTLAGAEWITGRFTFAEPGFQVAEVVQGLWFSVPFLGVLTVHEFGHYFTARHNRIRASLPYYIPFFTGFFNTLGTFGAVIRIKDRIYSRREYFDVGLAGPLAGFLVAIPVLIYGFTHLPPLEYIFTIHPEYRVYGAEYARYVYQQSGETITLAKPLLYQGLEYLFADPARLPHPNELMHYPVLMAGALSLFFTALNLVPIGQLDGGHILYGLLGFRRANRLSAALFIAFIFYAGLGLFSLSTSSSTWLYWGLPYGLYLFLVFRRALPTPRRGAMLALAVWAAQIAVASALPTLQGQPGWLAFGLLLGTVTGIYHPPAPNEQPLSTARKVLGWLMLLIFVLCFTPSPFSFT
ncbi:site-2 protease family protein [Hymenobacter lutimineralis]|uniref:Site-2 protease family protein n=1 Tax=Hymenobacter lutimineralis TaxID=2606448 RepID=A0A5D6V7R1_9BACT|nr:MULTISPECIES: site-2 protease family protein [Hymenobacter]QIX62897.1 site-2 protease family protein [Hymenobacter sp. BT18]TYZ10958.1 site-2 protease family protein [Hymenobacter lutimineralis]